MFQYCFKIQHDSAVIALIFSPNAKPIIHTGTDTPTNEQMQKWKHIH